VLPECSVATMSLSPPQPEWLPSQPLLMTARVETIQGDTGRYAPGPAGETRLFGHFPRPWPFHYGCLPGVVSTGDESVLPGPEGEIFDWIDAVICGGDFQAGQRAECRLVGIALRADGDHKLLSVATDAAEFGAVRTPDDLPQSVCGTVGDWFARQGISYEFAGPDRAWSVLEESIAAGGVPVNRYRCAGAVVLHEDQVLLLERPERDELRLPKGHVEAGESLEDAARRETREESGLRGLDSVSCLGTVRNLFHHDQRLWLRDETYFLLRWRGKRTRKGEQQFQRRWVSWAEAERLLTFASERHFVRQAARPVD